MRVINFFLLICMDHSCEKKMLDTPLSWYDWFVGLSVV